MQKRGHVSEKPVRSDRRARTSKKDAPSGSDSDAPYFVSDESLRPAPSFKDRAERLVDVLTSTQGYPSWFAWIFWRAPQAFWKAAWPTVTQFKVQGIIYAPWALLIGLWALSDILGSISIAPDSDGVDAGLVNPLAGLSALASGGSIWNPSWLGGHPFIHAAYIILLGAVAVLTLSFFGLAPLHVRAKKLSMTAPKLTSHGTASWGTFAEALQAGIIGPRSHGFVMGRVPSTATTRTDTRYRTTSHTMVIAPTESGKGTGTVIPTHLTYRGSLVSLDIKAENYEVTVRARKKLGQSVARLEPFGTRRSHSLNLLDFIDVKDESCISDAASLADMLVVRSAGKDAHFDEAAVDLLHGLILYAATQPKRRHLGTVREILTDSEENRQELFEELAESKELAFGIVARRANEYLSTPARERGSVISTARRHTRFLDDPRIMRTLTRSDFQLQDLKQGKLSLFIILPPNLLKAYRGYVRVILGAAIAALTRDPTIPDHDVLFLLDEFAELKRCTPVEDSITIARGYGIRFMLIVQQLSQIQEHYPDWKSLVSSCLLQVFGVHDLDTAKYVSESMGTFTEKVVTKSKSSTQGKERGTSSSAQNETFVARPLMYPSEVQQLPSNRAIILRKHHKPMQVERLNYLKDEELSALADANPLYRSSKAS